MVVVAVAGRAAAEVQVQSSVPSSSVAIVPPWTHLWRRRHRPALHLYGPAGPGPARKSADIIAGLYTAAAAAGPACSAVEPSSLQTNNARSPLQLASDGLSTVGADHP